MTKYGLLIQIIGLIIMGIGIYCMMNSEKNYLTLTISGLIIVMVGLLVIVFDKKKK